MMPVKWNRLFGSIIKSESWLADWNIIRARSSFSVQFVISNQSAIVDAFTFECELRPVVVEMSDYVASNGKVIP